MLTCFDNKTASGFGNVLLEEAFFTKGQQLQRGGRALASIAESREVMGSIQDVLLATKQS